jgi:hypothetical protein
METKHDNRSPAYYFRPTEDYQGWWEHPEAIRTAPFMARSLESVKGDFCRVWVYERSADGDVNNDELVGATTLLTQQVRLSLQDDDGLFWNFGNGHISTYEDCWENIAVFDETWDDEHDNAVQAVADLQMDHNQQRLDDLLREQGIEVPARLRVVR